jgi:hypothetical protein
MKIENIKNETFKKNTIDNEMNLLISSVYLKNKNILIWSYYRDRGKINVNDIIKKFGRNIIVINYSKETHIK